MEILLYVQFTLFCVVCNNPYLSLTQLQNENKIRVTDIKEHLQTSDITVKINNKHSNFDVKNVTFHANASQNNNLTLNIFNIALDNDKNSSSIYQKAIRRLKKQMSKSDVNGSLIGRTQSTRNIIHIQNAFKNHTNYEFSNNTAGKNSRQPFNEQKKEEEEQKINYVKLNKHTTHDLNLKSNIENTAKDNQEIRNKIIEKINNVSNNSEQSILSANTQVTEMISTETERNEQSVPQDKFDQILTNHTTELNEGEKNKTEVEHKENIATKNSDESITGDKMNDRIKNKIFNIAGSLEINIKKQLDKFDNSLNNEAGKYSFPTLLNTFQSNVLRPFRDKWYQLSTELSPGFQNNYGGINQPTNLILQKLGEKRQNILNHFGLGCCKYDYPYPY